jgi:hypothetical protein
MERHLAKNAITERLEALFASLSESINATNSGIVLPTADELREPLPECRLWRDVREVQASLTLRNHLERHIASQRAGGRGYGYIAGGRSRRNCGFNERV